MKEITSIEILLIEFISRGHSVLNEDQPEEESHIKNRDEINMT